MVEQDVLNGALARDAGGEGHGEEGGAHADPLPRDPAARLERGRGRVGGARDPAGRPGAEEGEQEQVRHAADPAGAVAAVEHDLQAPPVEPGAQADRRQVSLVHAPAALDLEHPGHPPDPAPVADLVAGEARARGPALDGDPGKVLLHVPEGTESAPQLQRLPWMHHRPFRGILGAALLLAYGGFDTSAAEEAARREAQLAKRRTIATLFAGDGPHSVEECEAMLRVVGDDQGLAETAIWIARDANVDLQQAAMLARDGGQELVNLKRSTELRDLTLFNREPAAFDDIPTFCGVPLARRMPDGSLSTTRPTIPYTFAVGRDRSVRQAITLDNGIVGWRDIETGEQELTGTADALRAAGVVLAADIPGDRRLTVRAPVPRGPGLQIRDARTAARMSLRDLGVRLGIGHVELGEMERNLRPVGPELWAKAREALPALPEAMPPETVRPRAERQVLNVDASLHPAGRCTCGGGGGGTCEWCRMDQHRVKREERKRGRAVLRRPVAEMKGDPELNSMLQEGILAYDRARKRLTRQAKQARKARRGW